MSDAPQTDATANAIVDVAMDTAVPAETTEVKTESTDAPVKTESADAPVKTEASASEATPVVTEVASSSSGGGRKLVAELPTAVPAGISDAVITEEEVKAPLPEVAGKTEEEVQKLVTEIAQQGESS